MVTTHCACLREMVPCRPSRVRRHHGTHLTLPAAPANAYRLNKWAAIPTRVIQVQSLAGFGSGRWTIPSRWVPGATLTKGIERMLSTSRTSPGALTSSKWRRSSRHDKKASFAILKRRNAATALVGGIVSLGNIAVHAMVMTLIVTVAARCAGGALR